MLLAGELTKFLSGQFSVQGTADFESDFALTAKHKALGGLAGVGAGDNQLASRTPRDISESTGEVHERVFVVFGNAGKFRRKTPDRTGF